MRKTRYVVLLAILAGALALGGVPTAQAQTPFWRLFFGDWDDQIQMQINSRLHENYDLRNVQASVDGRIVTLTGTVDSYRDRRDAQERASTMPGVLGVRNFIEVDRSFGSDRSYGPYVSDARLERQVTRAIYSAPALQKYAEDGDNSIDVTVMRGNVQLDGMVDSWRDKMIAGMRASSVPGVLHVNNNLIVAR